MTSVTLHYIANIRLPTEKAHGAQIIKTCEALAREGMRVVLVVPARRTPIKEDPFVYYGAQPLFKITRLPVVDLIFIGRIGFWLETLSFSIFALSYALFHPQGVYYSRDDLPLYIISFFKKSVVWESHGGRLNFFVSRLLRVSKKLVVITEGLKKFYAPHTKADIVVAPDGIDLTAFENPESKESARKRLGLPQDKKIALYIGRLDGWKGTDTLCDAAKYLPPDIIIAVIGGEESQVDELKERYPSVVFLGFRPYRELGDNQAAADVLVLPNTGKDQTSVHFTSPLKLFSYMAAQRPMVVSDLPSIREVVGEESAEFFIPDDAHSLAQAIERVCSDTARAQAIAAEARRKVEEYTWEARAKILKATIEAA